MKPRYLIIGALCVSVMSSCATRTDRESKSQAIPQKFVPSNRLGDYKWFRQLFANNDKPISYYFPEGINRNQNRQVLVREAEDRKGYLTDADILQLMGRPLLIKPRVYHDPESGDFDCEDWIYSSYRITLVDSSTKRNKKEAKSKAADKEGIRYYFNKIVLK